MAEIIGPVAVVNNTFGGYTMEPQTYLSYNWVVIGGNILMGQGTPVVTVQWTNLGTQSVECDLGNPQGYPDSVVINVDVSSAGGKPM